MKNRLMNRIMAEATGKTKSRSLSRDGSKIGWALQVSTRARAAVLARKTAMVAPVLIEAAHREVLKGVVLWIYHGQLFLQ